SGGAGFSQAAAATIDGVAADYFPPQAETESRRVVSGTGGGPVGGDRPAVTGPTGVSSSGDRRAGVAQRLCGTGAAARCIPLGQDYRRVRLRRGSTAGSADVPRSDRPRS